MKVPSATPKATKVLGVDASSKSLAFCLFVDDGEGFSPSRWGKMDIDGDDVFERCGDINRKLYGLMKALDPDHVCIESVIYVNNRSVVIQLAKIVGAMIGVVVATGRGCSEVPPVTWMNYIGNPTRDSPAFKKDVKAKFPDKSANWIKGELRRMRKQRTLDWVGEKFGIDIDDDDVGDSFGIGWWCCEEVIS